MALENRDYAGAAVQTTITASINATDLSISIASSTGWPSGGANGPFFIVIDRGLAGEEKIEVQSRTGTTLTVANTGKRGIDGTVATTHSSGASIAPAFTAQDANEANLAAANTVGRVTTKGDLLAGTGANALDRVAAGGNNTVLIADSTQATGVRWTTLAAASLAADSVTATQIATNAVGAAELADNAVDTAAIANLAVTGAKIANDTITATQIAADAIGTSELAADSVGSSELANGAIDDENLFSAGLSPVITQGSDPGAVGGNRFWFNTTKRTLLVRNAGDSAWDVMGGLGAAMTYTPATFNMTLGNGVVFGRYVRFGRYIVGNLFHRIGSTTVFGANIGFGLPAPAADLDTFVSYPGVPQNEFFGHGGSRATIAATGVFAAVGVVPQAGIAKALDRINFFASTGGIAWGGGIPGAWATGDRLSVFFEYEAADAQDANYV